MILPNIANIEIKWETRLCKVKDKQGTIKMTYILPNIEIKWGTRLCKVKDKLGYFHMWEHYSKPIEASLLKGGAPAGVFSKIFGIVEFSNGVERVDPEDIYFCDESHQMLTVLDSKNIDK